MIFDLIRTFQCRVLQVRVRLFTWECFIRRESDAFANRANEFLKKENVSLY